MTYASGGVIPPRDDNDDSIPVVLSSGYVIPASAVHGLGSFAVLNNFVCDDVISANPPETARPA